MSANCSGKMSSPGPFEFTKAWGEALAVLPSGGQGTWAPLPDGQPSHPIRLSLSGSLSSVARFHFTGRVQEYTMPLLAAIPYSHYCGPDRHARRLAPSLRSAAKVALALFKGRGHFYRVKKGTFLKSLDTSWQIRLP